MFVCVNENMLNKQFYPDGIWIVCVFQIPSGQTVCLAYFHLRVQTIVTVLPGWNLMIVCFRRIYTCWLNVEGKICSQIKPEILCLLWIFRDRKERKFGIKLNYSQISLNMDTHIKWTVLFVPMLISFVYNYKPWPIIFCTFNLCVPIYKLLYILSLWMLVICALSIIPFLVRACLIQIPI